MQDSSRFVSSTARTYQSLSHTDDLLKILDSRTKSFLHITTKECCGAWSKIAQWCPLGKKDTTKKIKNFFFFIEARYSYLAYISICLINIFYFNKRYDDLSSLCIIFHIMCCRLFTNVGKTVGKSLCYEKVLNKLCLMSSYL